MRLLQMSFAGAVLIIVAALIRAVAINTFPKKTFLILWGMVMLRLLIPFSISSELSIYSLVEQGTENNVGETVENLSLTPWNTGNYQMQTANELAQENIGIDSAPVWLILWALGAFACFLFFAVSYVRCKRSFETSFPVKNEFADQWLREHKLLRNVQIRQSGTVKAPLTYGLLHPVILVPPGMEWEKREQSGYVLMHELIHIKRFDVFTKSILILALCIHWFNPFVWLMYILCNRDIELSCDETVVRTFGIDKRSDYAYVLIGMEEMKSGFMPLCNNFSKNAIEERIKSIMKTKKTTAARFIAACALTGCVFAVFATNAKKEHANPAEASYAWEGEMTEHGYMAYQVSQNEYFSQYQKYGLSYDREAGYLIYDGHTVGYFKDELSENLFTKYVDETGEIGICVLRDTNWEITGIEQFPMSEVYFDEDSAAVENPMGDNIAVTGGEAFEEGEAFLGIPDEEYVRNGIEWNEESHAWFFEGKMVAVLYDDDGGIYQDERGIIYIEVLRDSNGNIEAIHEITKEQMQTLFHDNMKNGEIYDIQNE